MKNTISTHRRRHRSFPIHSTGWLFILAGLTITLSACYDSLPALDEISDPSMLNYAEIPAGSSTCPSGGFAIETGFDRNGNGTLEPDEVTATNNICHGESDLINVTPLDVGSASCPTGGFQVDIGQDGNGNGTLDAGEFTSYFVCRGGGLSQGSSTAPAVMNAVAGAGYSFPYSGAVTGSSTSYYTFRSDATADAPYSLRLHGTDSDLGLALFSDPGFTGADLTGSCDYGEFWLFKECSTNPLTAATSYYFTLAESASVNNQFLIEALFGAFEGLESSPIGLVPSLLPLPGGTPFAGSEVTGYVGQDEREKKASWYDFGTTLGAAFYSIKLDNIQSPGSEGTNMTWELFDSGGDLVTGKGGRYVQWGPEGPMNKYFSGTDLPDGSYKLKVTNSGSGARFALSVTGEDTLSVPLPATETFTVPAGDNYYTFTPTAGLKIYSIENANNAIFFNLYDGHPIGRTALGTCTTNPPQQPTCYAGTASWFPASEHYAHILNRGPTADDLSVVENLPVALIVDTLRSGELFETGKSRIYSFDATTTKTYTILVESATPMTINPVIFFEVYDSSGNLVDSGIDLAPTSTAWDFTTTTSLTALSTYYISIWDNRVQFASDTFDITVN